MPDLGVGATIALILGSVGAQTATSLYGTKRAAGIQEQALTAQQEADRRAAEMGVEQQRLDELERQRQLEEAERQRQWQEQLEQARRDWEAQQRADQRAYEQTRWEDYLKFNQPYWNVGQQALKSLLELTGQTGGIPMAPPLGGPRVSAIPPIGASPGAELVTMLPAGFGPTGGGDVPAPVLSASPRGAPGSSRGRNIYAEILAQRAPAASSFAGLSLRDLAQLAMMGGASRQQGAQMAPSVGYA